MTSILEVFVLIFKLCGVFLTLCILFENTRFWDVVHNWMEKHKNVTAVFVVFAMLGIVMSIIGSRF